MARGRTFHQRPVAAKRLNQWAFVDVDPTAIAADAVVLAAQLNAAALLLRPFTIVRTHILVQWDSDQLAATETPTGVLGVCVTSEQATGVTTIPNPMANADSSAFFVWQPLITSFIVGGGADVHGTGNQFVVDSKAMRKVGPNEQVRFMVENTSPTDGALITMIGRFLVKLH